MNRFKRYIVVLVIFSMLMSICTTTDYAHAAKNIKHTCLQSQNN